MTRGAGYTTYCTGIVIKHACGKGATGNMADSTILCCWHMVGMFANRRYTMTIATRLSYDTRVRVINIENRNKHRRVVARRTIGCCGNVTCRFEECIDTIRVDVTGRAWQCYGINNTVIEDTTHAEGPGAVTSPAFNRCHIRVARDRSHRIGTIVAGRAIITNRAVIDKCRQESGGGMAVTTIGFRRNMTVKLAYRRRSIMTCGATAGDARMIELSIRSQFEEAGSRMTIVTFGGGRQMEF